MYLIIAGGRDFDDYDLLKLKLDKLLSQTTDSVTIISGTARGADTLGAHYAKDHGYGLIEMPADWGKYGRSAGYRRNEDMAAVATHCACFWNGKSRGTKHMIDIAERTGLDLRIIRY